MRKTLAFITLLLLTLVCPSAQMNNPASWTFSRSLTDSGTCTVDITADIMPGWHIYDLQQYDGGPNPTVISFECSEGVEPVGEISFSKDPVRLFDDIFGMEIGYFEGSVTFSQTFSLPQSGPAEVDVQVEWMCCNAENCMPLEDISQKVVLREGPEIKPAEESSPTGSKGLWAMIIEAILWGFAALLTPCVFPMVPMTVSYFLKGSENKSVGRFRAAMYGLFIVLLYTVPIAVIILLTKFIGGDAVTADIFNWLSTHWLPNILFFIVFMVFAASFFGAFEIVLPSKIVNDSDQQVDRRKGLGGVFFLALTLVLVSFSCTGPIVGTVLIKATQGEFWTPIVAMLAFSLAFSLPFVLFALFPSMLKNLPKSGGWLNSVKVVLGFIEIALGFKFLSTADQVYHWHLLDREVYLAIWIVCFTLLGFYLLGKLKFKHDSDVKYVSVFRLALAIIVFTFVVYMVPGMWGAPLKALSGYLPPMETQDFVLGGLDASGAKQTYVVGSQDEPVSGVAQPGAGKYSDMLKLPHGLKGFFDLKEAQAYAASVGKPIFIDFTGHGCVNCREMEARVWSDPRVLDHLANDFVICALYCDDKIQVDASNWVTTPAGKTLKTLGKINSHYALEEYGANAQPLYIVEDAEGNRLTSTRGYNLDVEEFLNWLLNH